MRIKFIIILGLTFLLGVSFSFNENPDTIKSNPCDEVVVYDMLGNETDTLQSGVYIIKETKDGNTTTKKIVIN